MSLGVEVRTRTARVARGIPVNTGTWFVGGEAASGSTTEAVECRSISDFIAEYGPRSAQNEALFDAVDAYFAEGGKVAIVGRHSNDPTQALTLFDPALGPGQVSIIGETNDTTLHTEILAHANAANRVAILDVVSGASVVSMDAMGDALRLLSDASYGALFGPWVEIPAPSGVVGGSARTVPASPIIAALCARADSLGNPNRAAAGRDFPLQYVTGFTLDVSTVDREALLNAGVNTFATIYGVLENYGFQTAVAQTTEDPYWQFNCSRTRMWLKARAAARGEPYVFRTIDGRGRLQGALKGELDDVCLELYGVDGLFGETPQEAFSVEVGASINTVESIAQGELHAVMEARLSLHAKAVLIDLVTIPVTGQVSQPA